MQTPIDPGQLEYIREFIALLGQQVKKCTDLQIKKCAELSVDACKINNQELSLLFLLNERGTLAVKEIACSLECTSLSTLTRMLDKLEEYGYINRKLDCNDRRSFLISPTQKIAAIVESYQEQIQSVAYTMLEALSPAERLTLIELYGKIKGNLSRSDSNYISEELLSFSPPSIKQSLNK
ncbi:MarR family winged helix-turn-helix transcriptional regulator [Paenibacillus eucommiae]|uniref:DNA-binding MarR family transcriptional regulator n=1 Tax=Paenibacillus eucommiae TaxID=1355755 RepID=A0ABS4IYA6_9BACL|nr:MarR family transcriptional regulator [Paenibacillus eucommiae]MBP1992050.1 DNA-binding MarR family transcriptional regulator [Paenibacillus eucommiae]